MCDLKIAAVIPVKTFSRAKTRLDLPERQKEEICKIMLEEILQTVSVSPRIEEVVVVTCDEKVAEIGKEFGATIIPDREEGVNSAIVLADRYLLESNFDASIVLPQDIPLVKTQDIDFMMGHAVPPNFAIVVPSRRFDGTNALVRMPIDLMNTHYDEDSYKIHMSVARENTANAVLVFVKRIMLDVDNRDDVDQMLGQKEKPHIVDKMRDVLGWG